MGVGRWGAVPAFGAAAKPVCPAGADLSRVAATPTTSIPALASTQDRLASVGQDRTQQTMGEALRQDVEQKWVGLKIGRPPLAMKKWRFPFMSERPI